MPNPPRPSPQRRYFPRRYSVQHPPNWKCGIVQLKADAGWMTVRFRQIPFAFLSLLHHPLLFLFFVALLISGGRSCCFIDCWPLDGVGVVNRRVDGSCHPRPKKKNICRLLRNLAAWCRLEAFQNASDLVTGADWRWPGARIA